MNTGALQFSYTKTEIFSITINSEVWYTKYAQARMEKFSHQGFFLEVEDVLQEDISKVWALLKVAIVESAKEVCGLSIRKNKRSFVVG